MRVAENISPDLQPMIRILFIADTHLGIDMPLKPRVMRRRRGNDFFSNFKKALNRAIEGEADLIIHGGDLFYRSRVHPVQIMRVFEVIRSVAERGIPIFIVPGNHERSSIPDSLFINHPHIFIFDRPRTFQISLNGYTIALSGFPHYRGDIRTNFRNMVKQTGRYDITSDIHILCMHQTVEGAMVGPADYTFTNGGDVIKGTDIPGEFAAVLAGHIHRHQLLEFDLKGQRLMTQVFYPGSIERTSFAERFEKKGYLDIHIKADNKSGGYIDNWEFNELPARPMHKINLDVSGIRQKELIIKLQKEIASLNPDAIIRVNFSGEILPEHKPVMRADFLRKLAPDTMNISLYP